MSSSSRFVVLGCILLDKFPKPQFAQNLKLELLYDNNTITLLIYNWRSQRQHAIDTPEHWCLLKHYIQ
jgi:hypothetical protein